MIDNTINDDKTIAGGGEDAILAGRHHILTPTPTLLIGVHLNGSYPYT